VRTTLEGNTVEASRWLGLAKSKLFMLKAQMKLSGRSIASQWYDLAGQGVRVYVASVAGQDEIRVHARVGGILIICYVGDTTLGYTKKYYELLGISIKERTEKEISSRGWTIIDDGAYGKIWDGVTHDDPKDYSYTYTPTGGLAVPEVDSGIAAKRSITGMARVLLAQAVEDELYEAFQYSFAGPVTRSMVLPADSLTLAPYKLRGRPSLCRYVKDGIITINHRVEVDSGSILRIDQWQGDRFLDRIPIVHRIYKTLFAEGARSYATISNDDPSGDSAVLASLNKGEGQEIIRVETEVSGGSNLSEPAVEETYSIGDAPGLESTGGAYHRCSNTTSNSCGMLDAVYITGKTVDGSGFTTDSGETTIANDIQIIQAIGEGGLTYIRMEKDDEFTSHKCSLYVNGGLIEDSGWQSVITLYGDAPPTVAENNGPILIRQTAYRILHAHHGDGFNAAVYQKIQYVSNSNSLIPYTWEWDTGSATVTGQFRQTEVQWQITYFIAVNGVIHELPYVCNVREYRLTVLPEDYVGAPITEVLTTYQSFPWCDVGYDSAGNPTGETNQQITRIFTNAVKGKLVVGFDVFPAAWRHDLSYNAGIGDLGVDFDEGVIAFPPSVDNNYPLSDVHKWKLFDAAGALLADLTAPVDGSGAAVKRINGMCMVSV
jgi:hypothetical protein